jgi:hypothetical protein
MKNKKKMKKFYVIFALLALVSLTVTAQPQLTFRFNNWEVINAGTKLQFDVEVKANIAGSYQRDLQIYFDYNTAAFGSNIASTIVATPLTLMDAAKYSVVNKADNTSSKFAIITEANNEMGQVGSSTYYTEITTTYQGLLRFTVNILPGANSLLAGIAFDQALMNGGQYYQSTANFDPLKYIDPCLYENNLLTLRLSSAYGTITYANTVSTPLKFCTTTLSPGGDTYGPTINDGKYYFTGMSDGAYTIATSCTNNWGGVAGNDATTVKRWVSGAAIPLTLLQQKAGDVTNNGVLQGNDATLIARRVSGGITSWPAPDYVFLPASVNVASGLGTVNYQGLCSGDVTANHVPDL